MRQEYMIQSVQRSTECYSEDLIAHVTQQINRDNIEAAIDINSVANSYINTLNDLSITKMHNSSTLKTSSFIESIWTLPSSFNWFFDNLLSTDSEKHKEITSL
jgi:hypothetical protein